MKINYRLAVGVGAVIAFAAIAFLIFRAAINHGDDTSALTLLVIGGTVALLAVVALIAALYGVLDLADKQQALGLPEGSVRAVIALLLLVLFVMLAVFFYNGLQAGGPTTTLLGQTEAELTDFIAKHPDATSLSITLAKPAPLASSSAPAASNGPAASSGPANSSGAATDTSGKPAPPPRYDIRYGGANSNASDFAKTLMAALETLLTTVVGFYFGAKTATSSAAATAQQIASGNTPPPTLTSVDPPSAGGGPQSLKINGANLNPVVNAHIERTGDSPVALTNVASNPTQVTGQLAVTPAMAGAPWDVVVADGAGNMPRLKGALTIHNP